MKGNELSEELEKAVDEQVREMIGEDGYMGYCHLFWNTKKKVLHDQYGIDWKTPAEEYPHILFD